MGPDWLVLDGEKFYVGETGGTWPGGRKVFHLVAAEEKKSARAGWHGVAICRSNINVFERGPDDDIRQMCDHCRGALERRLEAHDGMPRGRSDSACEHERWRSVREAIEAYEAQFVRWSSPPNVAFRDFVLHRTTARPNGEEVFWITAPDAPVPTLPEYRQFWKECAALTVQGDPTPYRVSVRFTVTDGRPDRRFWSIWYKNDDGQWHEGLAYHEPIGCAAFDAAVRLWQNAAPS